MHARLGLQRHQIVEALGEHPVRERRAHPDVGEAAQEPRLQPLAARVLVGELAEPQCELLDPRQRDVFGHLATEYHRIPVTLFDAPVALTAPTPAH